ncbi:MAG: hypothetical protein ONA90_01725 [candidate division KSB1 bacterium]|nr:hypothetical protein [candidate division KSB1 bacterium]
MPQSIWFEDVPVIGKLPPERAAAKLREIGEDETAAALEEMKKELATRGPDAFKSAKGWWPFLDKPWQHTAHAFGHLAPAPLDSGPLPIRHAGNIAADPTLKNARIKITLDCLRVADYPGRGVHRVLMDFYAQNHTVGNVEHVHFNATYRVRENEHAAILGYPLFVGLNVGTDSVALKCFTVNVQNETDEALLRILESNVFKVGLQLTSTAQPVVSLFSELAFGVTKSIASRHRNVPVQDFHLGLDFSEIPTRARLAEGAYIAVQIPESLETVWDWSEWVYNPISGRIVHRDDANQMIPYNYLVLGISRYE